MDAIDDIGAVTVSFEIVFYSVMIVVNLLIFSTIVKMENTENYTVIIASLCFSDALVGCNDNSLSDCHSKDEEHQQEHRSKHDDRAAIDQAKLGSKNN